MNELKFNVAPDVYFSESMRLKTLYEVHCLYFEPNNNNIFIIMKYNNSNLKMPLFTFQNIFLYDLYIFACVRTVYAILYSEIDLYLLYYFLWGFLKPQLSKPT